MMTVYAYTRQYADETGASVHLALQTEHGMAPLNHGFGVLFAKADMSIGPDGCTKGVVMPWISRRADGTWTIAALPRTVDDSGHAEPQGSDARTVLLWHTGDFLHFDGPCAHTVSWLSEGDVIDEVRVAHTTEDGLELTVRVGSSWLSNGLHTAAPHERVTHVDGLWDAEGIALTEVSEQQAEALLLRYTAPRLSADAPRYPFPMMAPRGDPMAFRWKGGYLFMATDDERDQLALKIRYADRLADIASAEDHVIFRARKDGDLSGCLWAPELHQVGGRLCIFFAAGMPHWYTVQSRVMWLTGEDPLCADCWSEPRRMEREDGGILTNKGITLDMTLLTSGGVHYVCWSQRPITVEEGRVICGTADLMIAPLNTDKPWQLAGEPKVLSRPEYSWERAHSAVNEGPFMLKHEGRIYVTYAAALIDHTYAVGLLQTREGDDLMQLESWQKLPYPVLHRLSMLDQLGAGHNAFVKDENGHDVMLIHALSMENYRRNPRDGRRYPCMRQVVWDAEGFPHFDAWEKP